MKVLIVGSGAREHAIVRALMRDENVTGIECAPGNAGIGGDVTTHPLNVTDTQAIAALALERDRVVARGGIGGGGYDGECTAVRVGSAV